MGSHTIRGRGGPIDLTAVCERGGWAGVVWVALVVAGVDELAAAGVDAAATTAVVDDALAARSPVVRGAVVAAPQPLAARIVAASAPTQAAAPALRDDRLLTGAFTGLG